MIYRFILLLCCLVLPLMAYSQKKYPLPNSVVKKSTFERMLRLKQKMEIQAVQAKTDRLKGFEEKYAMGTIHDSLATEYNDLLVNIRNTILENDLSDRSRNIDQKMRKIDQSYQIFFSEYPIRDLNKKKVQTRISASKPSIKKTSRGGREGVPVPDFKSEKKEFQRIEEPNSGNNTDQIGAESNISPFSEEYLDTHFLKRYRIRLWEELLRR